MRQAGGTATAAEAVIAARIAPAGYPAVSAIRLKGAGVAKAGRAS